MSRKTTPKMLGLLCCIFFYNSGLHAQLNTGGIKIMFEHVANNQPLVFRDIVYTNAFGEKYQVTKLKYYISNIALVSNGKAKPADNVFLVDASIDDSIMLPAASGKYQKLVFTLGLDSTLNNSGAQDAALDPLNGMFWTWNSGYVYFKLEGISAASTADLQRIEHHIGGYNGKNNAARKIEIALPSTVEIKQGEVKNISIQLSIDHYWKGKNEIRISDNALIMAPGILAVKSAENFEGLFSITEIK